MKYLYNHGILDISTSTNGIRDNWYKVWKYMIRRCYDDKFQLKSPTYKGCSVSDEWLIASNFKEWYDANYIKGYELDKDILNKNNKIYSKYTCVFIPSEINCLFIDSISRRGKYALGVSYDKLRDLYLCRMWRDGKQKNFGRFLTENEAHEKWLCEKRLYARELAHEYYGRGDITNHIRDSIIRYSDALE